MLLTSTNNKAFSLLPINSWESKLKERQKSISQISFIGYITNDFFYRTRGIPTHLLGSQPNGRQEQQQVNDNDHNSSDTSVEDSKIQFQNNLRKFKAKCDNELEKLLEKCESRRRSNDRKFFGSESVASSSRLSKSGDLGARNARRLESTNNNFNANKDDDETGT